MENLENYNSDQLTSTSEVTCASVVIIPSIPIKKAALLTDSDTMPMAPISAIAQSSRPRGSNNVYSRTPHTTRTAQNSICCLLL